MNKEEALRIPETTPPTQTQEMQCGAARDLIEALKVIVCTACSDGDKETLKNALKSIQRQAGKALRKAMVPKIVEKPNPWTE